MVPVVQLVRASDCGSECRRFESDQAPIKALHLQGFFFVVVYDAFFLITKVQNFGYQTSILWLSKFCTLICEYCFLIIMKKWKHIQVLLL